MTNPDSINTDAYLSAEAKARLEIDKQLRTAGWVVQDRSAINLLANSEHEYGVAVREFIMKEGHGRADYLLFVNRRPVASIEAKPQGTTLTEVELQSLKYVTGVPDALPVQFDRLPFAYESTGTVTRFTNGLDPEPRSRRVFAFHRPETLSDWIHEHFESQAEGRVSTPLARLQHMPALITDHLWGNQVDAIRNLEASLAKGDRRALIQMATGSGKTFTAANFAYRLIKDARVRRILFLVDRGNLGRQTFKEFGQFSTPDDGRKLTELYNVQHLTHNKLDKVARVTISTIQRLYSILRGEEELEESLDEMSGAEIAPSQVVEVAYNPSVPPEFFDVIIVDECHRSIYGVWRQVLEYFDATIIGLTATPSKQTFGFFNGNLVMEYGREQAVADGVNVDFTVYRIKTEISEQGSTIEAGLVTAFRDRETKALRWEKLDEPVEYEAKDLDRKVVAKDQIRTVIETFKDGLPVMFSGRTHVPKTLIFAKDDSHADDVVQIVRDVFGKGNEFAVKITYRTNDGKPDELLANFRNSYDPRIVVTVDMVATGTDVRPLEIVFFLRQVKSRVYFEQMIGRGARIINETDLHGATPDARSKTHFVIVDAVGVTETELMDSRPLDRKPTVSLKKLLQTVAQGMATVDDVSSLAGRLARLNRQVTPGDREQLETVLGRSLQSLTAQLVEATDPDRQLDAAKTLAAGDVRLVQLADIGDGQFRDRSARFLTSEKAAELHCTFLRPGDVLVARMPDPLGRACLFPGVGQPAVTAVDVAVVRPANLGVVPRWLMHFINAPQFRAQVLKLQSGTTRKRISRRNLATISLPVPPPDEQQWIVDTIEEHFSRFETVEAAINRSLIRAPKLRQAVLADAFCGRLTTRSHAMSDSHA